MEAIGRLVSGVAHDFNNLLTGIVLCSDLLLAGLEENSPLRRYAKEIRTASAQSAGMIRQLLDVARPNADERTFLSINDVIADYRSPAPGARITLSLAAPQPGTVGCPARRTTDLAPRTE